MNGSIPAKDVIYVDVDDEITTIIDKVRSSHSKILALVLPKRAATLQSAVNMKLLKKSADNASKHIVLITNEEVLMQLAANIGMYVAKNLQTKPEIPDMPHMGEMPEDGEETLSLEDKRSEAELDKNTPIGKLAQSASSPTAIDDSFELDNSEVNALAKEEKARPSTPVGKKNKKLKVPNFSSFRMWLFGGAGALVVLVLFWILAFKVLPKAHVLVKTNSTAVNATVPLALSTTASSVDPSNGAIPAQAQTAQKVATQQADATGQHNNGQKASGSVTMTAQECGVATQAPDVPSGAGVSANGITFITQQDTSFSAKTIKNGCISFTANAATPVIAQNAGSNGNVGPSTFTVAGRSDVSATSSAAMTGGTDDITKFVQQSDIDGAKAKLASQDTTAIKQQLSSQLTNMGLTPIQVSFSAGNPDLKSSVNAGDQADSVTITQTITYTMSGVKSSDLQVLIKKSVGSQIDTTKQVITDYGLTNANFSQLNGSTTNISMQVTAIAGPDLKVGAILAAVAGKKTGDATQIIKENPGVTDVTITYSPFWVSSIPNNTSKITVVIDKPQTTVNAN